MNHTPTHDLDRADEAIALYMRGFISAVIPAVALSLAALFFL
jgi:hypothetical protein